MSALRTSFPGPDIAAQTKENHGGTYVVQHTKNGVRVDEVTFDSGYIYSVAGREEIIPTEEFTNRRIGEYVGKNLDILTEPGYYLGFWENRGVINLDVSRHVPALIIAAYHGYRSEQEAIWDCEFGVAIPINDLLDDALDDGIRM